MQRRLQLRMLLAAICATGIILTFRPANAATSELESAVQGALLVKLPYFIEWPDSVFTNRNQPIRIGILGAHYFGDNFASEAAKQKVNGRPITVQQYTALEELNACHVLFVSPSEASNLPSILAALKSTATVTVSATEGFVENGGMFNFTKLKSQVRFEINLQTAKDARLKIDPRLLEVSIVRNTK